MKDPYGEGVANHTGPESCGGGSNTTAEALTGVRTGQVLSCEILFNFGVPTLWDSAEGNIGCLVRARGIWTLRSRRPCACTETPSREPGDPMLALSPRVMKAVLASPRT